MINTSKLNVTVAFKGMDSSDAVREYAEKRAGKVLKHVQHLTTCHYAFEVAKTDHVAQLHVVSGDFEARAEAREENMYAAIDAVTDKIEQQSRKHKEKIKDHTGRPHHGQE
jgi:putative sigma-54 modulation protein